MTSDRTQHQSSDELRRSQELSMESSRPPAMVPGYSLQQFLGSGSFGEVWSATDLKTGRRVAIKFYTRGSKSDVQLMAQEVEKLAVLAADRYVVQLLDVGWNADPPYYVMDYVEHGSLEERLRGGRTMSTQDAVELFHEVAVGMMHLHGKGILHCDLKPGNVLLDQDGKPRVADFGQSRLHSDNTPSLGTLFFMAPEQADLNAIPDARWDVYGLGALLYCMLTGKPPYYCPEIARQLEKTAEMDTRLAKYQQAIYLAPRPTEHRRVDGVDRSLAEIIDRCIDPNPKSRYGSVQSVLLALRQRDAAKARRPLLVLGLLGPLLLLSIISFFGIRAYFNAIGDTDQAITDKAVESNEYAAKYAARSATESISEYFRVVHQLANDPEFLQTFSEVVAHLEDRNWLAPLNSPGQNEAVIPDRQRVLNDPVRQRLQPFLESRIRNENDEFPNAASWFVNDRAGNQLASAYSDAPAETGITVGKNYSYRTYFTGDDRDRVQLDEQGNRTYSVDPDPQARQIIEDAHLSAIFLSEGSNTWKLAFSVPLRRGGEVVGIVALTVNVGSFVDFPNARNRYAMLVDAREGDNRGVILEHPLFADFASRQEKLPDDLVKTALQDPEVTSGPGFVDPISKYSAGEAYRKSLVVASAPVNYKRQADEEPIATGLVVLAVEDYAAMIEPVHVLGTKLWWLGALATALFLSVTIAMWVLVIRMLRDNRQRLNRWMTPYAEASALEDLATVAMLSQATDEDVRSQK